MGGSFGGDQEARTHSVYEGRVIMDAREAFEKLIKDNIFGYWEQMIDEKGGGFFSTKYTDNILQRDAARGLVQHARHLWTYSAMHRLHPAEAYRRPAQHAYRYLRERFRDPAGPKGWFYLLDGTGQPADTRYHMYAFSFVIYAMSEYYRAFGVDEAREEALFTFRLIETHAKDSRHGGYHETFTRLFEPLDQIPEYGTVGRNKTMNTHIHLMEAYTNLLRIAPQEEVSRALENLVDVCADKIVDRAKGRLNLYFTPEWAPIEDHVSYGHDIEFSWLLWEAVESARYRENDLKSLILKMADSAEAGLDRTHGGMYYEGDPRTARPTVMNKVWWVQAEAAVGYTNAYLMSGDNKYLARAREVVGWILREQIDYAGGEWFDTIFADGTRGREKASVWKASYHTGRALLMLLPHAGLFADLVENMALGDIR